MNLFKVIEADLNRIQHHASTQQAQDDEHPEPGTNLADSETAIQQVLGRIFSTPSDSTRGVLFLNDADLKDRYLRPKGEAKIAESLDDEQVAAIFPSAGFQFDGKVDASKAILFEEKNFDMTSLNKPIASSRPYAVLLNVPKNLAQYLGSKNPTDIAEARNVIKQIIAHKNYVATLNASSINKAGVGALTDRDEREEKFNIIKFITAYPVRALIDAARQEQQDKDRNRKITPDDKPQAGDEPAKKAKATLTDEERKMAVEIGTAARRIFFAQSSTGWPDTPEDLKKLREKLVSALTKDQRISDRAYLIPEIVKAFYTKDVKQDKNYKNLLKLLSDDATFMKLASGEEAEVDGEDEQDDQVDDEGGEEEQPPVESTPKTPEETADEIKAQGDDYASQVAKILGGKSAEPTPAPAPSATDNLPDDVKAEVERLTKIKNNAINPKQREKAASDIATLLHREEEKRKAKPKKAK